MSFMRSISSETAFNLAKAFIYVNLCYSGSTFIVDDFAAAAQLINANSTLTDYHNVFAITLDVVAWLLLLVTFELETNLVSDETLNRGWKYVFRTANALCYIVILYAFAGYYSKLTSLMTTIPYALGNPCDLVGSSIVLMTDADEYTSLTLENCSALDPNTMGQLSGRSIIYEQAPYGDILNLSWVDLLNSGTWLIVVAMLQLDIIMQQKGYLTPRILKITGSFKVVIYGFLFVIAGYWGVNGTFIDFWDAAMWLAGFILIDLNILQWNAETEAEKKADAESEALPG